ncbi:MAG: carbon-nitrogen hydrolase family protein [Candidatus Metalachnospira sp.]|nr:carbon-nitrogen hydrolase family protein [Candidatus Metalachnospira sp.]
MDREKVKFAAVRMKSISGDISENLKKIETICTQAHERGIDIICFPELAVTGADADDLGLKLFEISESIPGRVTNQLSQIAQCCHLYIVIGMSQKSRVPGRLFNTQVIISPEGKIKAVYQKINPEGIEQLYYKGSVSKEIKVLELPFAKVGLLMGNDEKCSETVKKMQEEKVRVILMSSASTKQDICQRQDSVRELAKSCGAYVIASDNNTSFIVLPNGTVQDEIFAPNEMIEAEIDRQLLYKK